MTAAEIEPRVRRVDKYEVLSVIGKGGMATVFNACLRAPGGASKRVALKLIHPHLSQEPEFIGLFLNEMRIAMSMSHRNIVQTFDAGQTDEGYYLVMELIDHGSLARLIGARGDERLPLDVALFVAGEVCAALEYAHAFQPEGGGPRGVVHRDVSPGNILLSSQGDVKLADFGVAKAAGLLTTSYGGMIKGKLAYMAPEQARGRVLPTSDLFALGVVLYHMVTGEPLRRSPSIDEVRCGVDQAVLRGLGPASSASLAQIIARCLSRDPGHRHQSAAELGARIEDERERIKRQQGLDRSSRRRLGDLLGLPSGPSSPAAGGEGQPARLADAIRQVALAVPSRPAPAPASEASGVASDLASGAASDPAPVPASDLASDLASSTFVPGTTRGEPGNRLRGVTVFVAALLLLAVAAAVFLWLIWSPGDLSPSSVASPGTESGTAPAASSSDARWRRPDAAPDAGPDAGPGAAPAAGLDAGPDAGPDVSGTPAATRVPIRSRDTRPRRHRQGKLDLNTSPWARVYIGRRHLGDTPIQGLALRAGRHRLRLINPQRRLSTTITVRIRAGRTTRRSVRLVAQPGER